MEALDSRYQLESQIQRDAQLEEIQTRLTRSQHANTKLVKALLEANDSILTAAATADEPDKLLAVSKGLTKVLADMAVC